MFSQIPLMVLLAACVAAQNLTVESFFNISLIPLNERSSWCTSQFSVCSTLCQGATSNNTCLNSDLDFSCLCASNGSQPGLEFYQNTIPTLECTAAYANCITLHPNDLTGQDACATDINSTCGILDSNKATFTSSSSSAAASSTSASATSSNTASATSTSASASSSTTAKSDAVAVVGGGQHYSVAALAVGLMAAFGFML